MSTEIATQQPESIITINRDTPIMDIYTFDDIDNILQDMTQRFRISGSVVMDNIRTGMRTSPYFFDITDGTIGGLIDFLRAFQSRSQCAFYHEQIIRIIPAREVLTPEICMKKDTYAGCGHPELNGLLIAIVLAEDILGIAEDTIRDNGRIPPYVAIRQLDARASTQYYTTEIGGADFNYIRGELTQQQQIFGEKNAEYAHFLSQQLEKNLR